MKIIDLTKNISISGLNEVNPFILGRVDTRDKTMYKTVPFWLEYSPNDVPTADEISAKPETAKCQTLGRFMELPRLAQNGAIFQATAERIPGGDIGIVKFPGLKGCLWTMIPAQE